MDRALRSRLMKGLGAQGFGQLVGVFIQLATVPLLLSTWGITLYGEWLLLVAISAYLAVIEAGFSNAAIYDMTMAAARHDIVRVLESFQSTWILILACYFALIGTVSIIIFVIPINVIYNIEYIDKNSAIYILLILSGHIFANSQTNLIYAGYQCNGAYGLGQLMLVIIRIIEFTLLALAALLGGGPVVAAAGLFSGRLIGILIMRLVLRRTNPGIVFGWKHGSLATIRRLFGPAWASMGLTFGHALNLQGTVLVVGIILGAPAVVIYSTLRTMTNLGTQLIGTIANTISPEISTAYGAGNADLLRRLHHRACQMSLWLAIAVAVGLLLLGGELLRLWTRGAVDMHLGLMAWMLAILLVHAVWYSSLVLQYATNRIGPVALAYCAVRLLAVAVAYGAASSIGLNGVAMAVLAAEMTMVAYVVHRSLRYLNEPPGQFVSMIVRPPLTFLVDQMRRLSGL